MAMKITGRPRQTTFKLSRASFDVRPLMLDSASAPYHVTELGAIFSGDCLDVLPTIRDEVADTIFADPPFNLGKEYGERTNDLRPDYIDWCYRWLAECIRILKPGGSLFVYNLPKWNIPIGAFLGQSGLDFRHWIAVEISACLPI